MTIAASWVEADPVKVKAYIDGLSPTTIANLEIVPFGKQVLVVVDYT